MEELNNMGIKNKCGKPFCSDYISRILQNKRYIGILSKTYETEEKSPKIIDEETFNLANEKLKMNKGKNAKYKADELYYLSGKTIVDTVVHLLQQIVEQIIVVKFISITNAQKERKRMLVKSL